MATLGETSEYLFPGAYIGQLIRPASAAVSGFPRLPVFVAKGSRVARSRNSEIIRSKVFDETLTFSGVGPFKANLDYQADGIKSNTTILRDGVPIQNDKYLFSTNSVVNDQITIPSQHYDATATYVITYQSVDRDVLDAVPFEDLRNIERVGRSVDSSDYDEYEDFFVPVTVGSPSADSGNTHTDGDAWGTTNGAAATAVLAGPSNEDITLTLVSSPDEEDGSAILVTTQTGGAEAITEDTGARTVTVTYQDGVSTQTSLNATITAALSGLTLVDSVSGDGGSNNWSDPAQTQSVYSSSLDPDGANSGAGEVALSPNSDYTHDYTRDYTVECVTGGDADTAVFAWYSNPNSLGNSMGPYNPIHPDLNTTAAHRNEISTPGNDTDAALEYGLQIRVHDQGGTFSVGDKWTFRAFGPGKVEADPRHSATNQFTDIDDVVTLNEDAGTNGVLSVSSESEDYTGTYNREYYLVVSAISAGTSVTFKWCAVGDDGIATGTTAALEDGDTALLDEGLTIQVDLSGGDFTVDDQYRIDVNAARLVPTVKDDRTYTFEVSAAATGDVDFIFTTDTPEGGIGSFEATTADPHIELVGNLVVHVRNVLTPRYGTGDDFTMSVTLDDVIDWSLRSRVTETVSDDDIIHDVLGRVTGTADTYYIILNNAPDTIVSLKDSTDADVSGTIVTSGGSNTRFINLGSTDPGDDLTVIYEYRGEEPAPGETYRFTALYLREDDLYNTPILVTDEAAGKALTEPMGTNNHLAIVNAIAWDYDPIGIYLCQVKDQDDDGIFQDSDYETAIDGTEGTSDITDLVVLDRFTTLGAQLTHINKMANPLENKQRLVWIGAPIDTPIGDVNTSGSLVYTSRVTTAVFGDSQAHGTRIMVAPTSCNRTITFDDGSTPVDVDLDGSFVAAAFALTYASFRNPSDTALRTDMSAFNSVQTYTEDEEKLLGAAQINFVREVGDGVYRWQEDVTTDPIGTDNAPDEFRIISAMIQKRFINRRIQHAIDRTVISLVPDAPEAGLATLRNVINNVIKTDVSRKYIGEYLNDDGTTIRRLNPSEDIIVYRDKERPTVYRFFVGYFLRYPIKYVFGLALTDSNEFGSVNT